MPIITLFRRFFKPLQPFFRFAVLQIIIPNCKLGLRIAFFRRFQEVFIHLLIIAFKRVIIGFSKLFRPVSAAATAEHADDDQQNENAGDHIPVLSQHEIERQGLDFREDLVFCDFHIKAGFALGSLLRCGLLTTLRGARLRRGCGLLTALRSILLNGRAAFRTDDSSGFEGSVAMRTIHFGFRSWEVFGIGFGDDIAILGSPRLLMYGPASPQI